MTAKKLPELRVVFDTNVIYTDSEQYLVRREVTELIKSSVAYTDIVFTWYIPDVVKRERIFRMAKKAKGLLGSLRKIEQLVGVNFNVNEVNLSDCVNKNVDSQIQKLGLSVLSLDVRKVDWEKLIEHSVLRLPPFENGEKEKGFRDALIAESFAQLVEAAPKTPSVCRLVLVTGDEMLRVAMETRTKESKNVRILGNTEELKSLINGLVENMGEELVKQIAKKAEQYFFQKDDQSTLYYRERIGEKIGKDFSNKLTELPEGASSRKNPIFRIGAPTFVKKERGRIEWATRIVAEAEAYRQEVISPSLSIRASGLADSGPVFGPVFGSAATITLPPFKYFGGADKPDGDTVGALSAYLRLSQGNPVTSFGSRVEEVLHAQGTTTFEVRWQVTVSVAKHKFSKPKILGIEFFETTWKAT